MNWAMAEIKSAFVYLMLNRVVRDTGVNRLSSLRACLPSFCLWWQNIKICWPKWAKLVPECQGQMVLVFWRLKESIAAAVAQSVHYSPPSTTSNLSNIHLIVPPFYFHPACPPLKPRRRRQNEIMNLKSPRSQQAHGIMQHLSQPQR